MTVRNGVLSQFPRSFWAANTMEILERMGWYDFYAVSSLYLTCSVALSGTWVAYAMDETLARINPAAR